MNVKRYIFLLAIGLGHQVMMAQNEAQSSQYWAVPTSFNAAMAGCDSALHVTAYDRMQWVGVEGAPKTFYASADMPIQMGRRRLGAGVSVMNDKAGLFTTTHVNLQLSVSLRLWGGRMAIGLQPGFVNQAFDGSGISVPSGEPWGTGDELPTGTVAGKGFDLGLGVYYERGMWYGGLSMLHLTETELKLGNSAYSKLQKTAFFLAGGNIPIKNTLFIIQPSVLVKTVMSKTQTDVTLRMTYDWGERHQGKGTRRFWGGLTFRPEDAVVVMVGADVGAVRLGYSYDIGISALARESNGSHEIMATWTMPIELEKRLKHPRKSIRIL